MRVLAGCLVLALGALGATPVKEVRRTVPLAADGRLYIESYKGSVDITGWDRAQVEISARIEPGDGLLSSSEECVERTGVRIDSWPDSLRLYSDYRRVRENNERGFLGLFELCPNLPAIHYRIRMPRSAHLRIRDRSSRIEVADLDGGADVNTYRGSVNGVRLAGPLDLETYRGDVRVEVAGLEAAARFQTYRGEIEVRVPRDSRFDLATDIGKHGSLESSFRPRTRSVNGGGPLVRLKTFRGTIRLRAS